MQHNKQDQRQFFDLGRQIQHAEGVRLTQLRNRAGQLEGTGAITTRQHRALIMQIERRSKQLHPNEQPPRSRASKAVAAAAASAEPRANAGLRARLMYVDTLMKRDADLYYGSPQYRALYAKAGGPDGMKEPHPTFSGAASTHRYVYIRAITEPATYDAALTATGRTVLVLNNPFRNANSTVGTNANAPLKMISIAGSAGPAFTAADWTHVGAIRDRAYYTDVVAGGKWTGHTYPTLFEGSDHWGSEASGEVVTTNTNTPDCHLQLLALETRMSVATVFGSQARVYIFNEDNPLFPHTNHEQSKPNDTSAQYNLNPELLPRCYVPPNAPTAATPVGVYTNVTPTLIPDCSERHFTFHASPAACAGWNRFGQLAIADAANGTVGGVNFGVTPRDNVAWDSQYGAALITTSVGTTGSVSVTARTHAVFAAIIKSDDGNRTLSQLANSIATSAALLRVNNAVPGVLKAPVPAAATAAESTKNKLAAIKSATGGTVVPEHSGKEEPSFFHKVEDFVKGAASTIADVANAYSSVAGIFSKAKPAVGASAPANLVSSAWRSNPSVMEVIEEGVVATRGLPMILPPV